MKALSVQFAEMFTARKQRSEGSRRELCGADAQLALFFRIEEELQILNAMPELGDDKVEVSLENNLLMLRSTLDLFECVEVRARENILTLIKRSLVVSNADEFLCSYIVFKSDDDGIVFATVSPEPAKKAAIEEVVRAVFKGLLG